ncbi:hypothetical protein D3C84_916000 [compost metagenome]
MRGSSHFAAKAGLTVMVSPACTLASFSRLSPTDSRSNPSRMSGSAARAASVSTRRAEPLPARANSAMPSQDSRLRTCCPTAAGVTFSSAAAAEKLRCLAAASKARSALR